MAEEEPSEDLKRLYQETIKHCLRKNNISDVCVEFLKTGKMQIGCMESCTTLECVENLEQCVSQRDEMKAMQSKVQKLINGEFRIRIL